MFIALSLGWVSLGQAAVSFNRDVLPISPENVSPVTGWIRPSARPIWLDEKASAYVERDGVRAVVPGQPEANWWLESFGRRRRGIPPRDEVGLTEAEKATLQQWISEGAVYETHWAFETPEKPKLPRAANGDTGRLTVLSSGEWLRQGCPTTIGFP